MRNFTVLSFMKTEDSVTFLSIDSLPGEDTSIVMYQAHEMTWQELMPTQGKTRFGLSDVGDTEEQNILASVGFIASTLYGEVGDNASQTKGGVVLMDTENFEYAQEVLGCSGEAIVSRIFYNTEV